MLKFAKSRAHETFHRSVRHHQTVGSSDKLGSYGDITEVEEQTNIFCIGTTFGANFFLSCQESVRNIFDKVQDILLVIRSTIWASGSHPLSIFYTSGLGGGSRATFSTGKWTLNFLSGILSGKFLSNSWQILDLDFIKTKVQTNTQKCSALMDMIAKPNSMQRRALQDRSSTNPRGVFIFAPIF